MSKNIEQVYVANPITTNQGTDLMYFGRSPYGATDDTAMLYSNFALQFGAPYTAAALTKTDDTNVTLTLGGTPGTALLQATSITAGWTGTLSPTRGGTGISTYTLGDILYSSATNTLAKLAGNITSGIQYLSQTGTGVASAAPVWSTISGGDITGAALTKTDDTNVTMTLGGTPSTALLRAASMTLGWTGQLSLTRGGSNASLTASNGGIIYSTATAMAVLSGTSTANQVLVSGSNAAPSWSTATFPSAAGASGTILRSNGTGWVASTSTFADTYAASTILYSNGANTVQGLATANSAMLVTNSTGVPAMTASLTNGQVIIGSTGATPTPATLTEGTGITITNGAGSITIASSGASPWIDQTTSSVTMSANTGYTSDAGASLVTFTLPTASSIGDWVEINGKAAGLWKIAQASGQQIHVGSSATTSGAPGSLSSVGQFDCVRLRCITANTIWVVVSQQSTGLTIV